MKRQWLVPAALMCLSGVPLLAGAARLVGLVLGRETLPEHARFAGMPLPVAVHIVGATLFATLGALQMGEKRGRTHRLLGWCLAPLGLLGALSGAWLTLFLPRAPDDSAALITLRLCVATAMIVFIVLAVRAVFLRDYRAHGRWMIRAYALGLGAGTQVFTLLPSLVFVALRGAQGRVLLMALGWAMNVLVAEWVLRSRRRFT